MYEWNSNYYTLFQIYPSIPQDVSPFSSLYKCMVPLQTHYSILSDVSFVKSHGTISFDFDIFKDLQKWLNI